MKYKVSQTCAKLRYFLYATALLLWDFKARFLCERSSSALTKRNSLWTKSLDWLISFCSDCMQITFVPQIRSLGNQIWSGSDQGSDFCVQTWQTDLHLLILLRPVLICFDSGQSLWFSQQCFSDVSDKVHFEPRFGLPNVSEGFTSNCGLDLICKYVGVGGGVVCKCF